MRYHRVATEFWQDTVRWDPDERWMALYLLTSPHRITEGLFRLMPAYAAAELGWTLERVANAMALLEARDWASLDHDHDLALIHKALKRQPPAGEKQTKGAAAAVEDLPRQSPLYAKYYAAACEWAPDLASKLIPPTSDAAGTTIEAPSEANPPPPLAPPPLNSTSSSTSTAAADTPEAIAAAIAPDPVRSMLRTAGFDQLEIDQADGAIANALGELTLPDDVDWWRFGQEIQKALEAGRMRRATPASAIRFIARGASGPPRLGGGPGAAPSSRVGHYAAMASGTTDDRTTG